MKKQYNEWSYLGLFTEKTLTKKVRNRFLDKFLDVVYNRSEEGEELTGIKTYEVFVKGYNEVPKELDPGGGFLPVIVNQLNSSVGLLDSGQTKQP